MFVHLTAFNISTSQSCSEPHTNQDPKLYRLPLQSLCESFIPQTMCPFCMLEDIIFIFGQHASICIMTMQENCVLLLPQINCQGGGAEFAILVVMRSQVTELVTGDLRSQCCQLNKSKVTQIETEHLRVIVVNINFVQAHLL